MTTYPCRRCHHDRGTHAHHDRGADLWCAIRGCDCQWYRFDWLFFLRGLPERVRAWYRRDPLDFDALDKRVHPAHPVPDAGREVGR